MSIILSHQIYKIKRLFQHKRNFSIHLDLSVTKGECNSSKYLFFFSLDFSFIKQNTLPEYSIPLKSNQSAKFWTLRLNYNFFRSLFRDFKNLIAQEKLQGKIMEHESIHVTYI